MLSHISYWYSVPSIAQLVERRTVVEELKAEILRSLVRIRFEGSILPNYFNLNRSVNVHNKTYIFEMILCSLENYTSSLGTIAMTRKKTIITQRYPIMTCCINLNVLKLNAIEILTLEMYSKLIHCLRYF